MNAPPPLVYLVHNVAAAHYRQHHRDRDGDGAEQFADALVTRIFSRAVQVEAAQAIAALDAPELPYVSPGADDTHHLAGVLREKLHREIRGWLLSSRIWFSNVEQKSAAYARAVV